MVDDHKRCPHCGKMIHAGAIKCCFCGKILDEGPRAGVPDPLWADRLPSEPSNATTIFVIGLLGLLVCQVLGIVAFFMGRTYKQQVASGVVRRNGLAEAGYILGLISMIMVVVAIFAIIAAVVLPNILPGVSTLNKAPKVLITGGLGDIADSRRPTFSFSGSDFDGIIVGYYVSFDNPIPEIWTDTTSYRPSFDLSIGGHTFYVQAVDDDGAQSSVRSRSFVVKGEQLKQSGETAEKVLEVEPDNKAAEAIQKRNEETLKTFTNSIGMKFVLIPAGEFMMGSPASEKRRDTDEGPQHKVKITKPFYMQTTEVTQAQWKVVMGNNPSYLEGDNLPVEQVSWNDVQEFLEKLSAKEGVVYRLPTEAEWEYACRAGTTTRYYFGSDPGKLGEYAWYENNSKEKTHPVGQKKPNAWGLYDMHGNAWEWCQDWWAKDYYSKSPASDPQGPENGEWRVIRGGTRGCNAWFCRSAYRAKSWPWFRRGNSHGFRAVRNSQ